MAQGIKTSLSSTLTVTGTLANATEAYGQPTIWLLKDQGKVDGSNVPVTVNTTIVTGQTQYYLEVSINE